MNKFHQIPTDQYVPISYDNSYLFSHYDKVANFLAFSLERNFKNILAKPVQNGYFFDWFSPYENLIINNQNDKTTSESSLILYWEFIDIINAKINQLANSNDENNRNWAELLTKVFNHQDNFIFSNGKDICIVWGWKFDNNEIYKPNLLRQNSGSKATEDDPIIEKEEESTPTASDDTTSTDETPKDPIEDELPMDEGLADEETEDILPVSDDKRGFLEFLKWFASKYWWFLVILMILTLLAFFIKTIIYSNQYNQIGV